MFAICMVLYLKKDFKYNLPLYLIAYGIFRFLIEYVRNDSRGELIGAVSPSQFWSIVMVVIGIALIFYLRIAYKKHVPYVEEEKEID